MVIGTPTVLNLIPGGVMKVIHVNQVNENIEIQFRIMNGAQPFNVPEGVSCTIRGTKGDNFGYAADVAVTAGSNIVTVTLTEQLTAVAGAGNIFELVFVGASDDMKVSTENFLLDVERAALGEDTVISDSDLAYADQVLNQLQSVGAVNAQVQQNKANIAAEITRATAAEQTLQQNINAEAAARQAADNTLQSNINAEASSRATTDASLQSQINQLVAPSGEAPSAAEVQNARIGTDGTVYPTLGDAIRTQNSLLKSQLDAAINKGNPIDSINFTTSTVINGAVGSNGRWYSSTSEKYTSYLYANDSYRELTLTTGSTGAKIAFLAGDEAPTPVDGANAIFAPGESGIHSLGASVTQTLEIPDGCTWIVIQKRSDTQQTTPVSASFTRNSDFAVATDADIKYLKNQVVNPFDIEWVDGYVHWQSGAIITNTSYRRSDYLSIYPNQELTVLTHNVASDSAGVAFYDKSKSFIGGFNVYNMGYDAVPYTFTAPQTAYYIIVSAKVNDGFSISKAYLKSSVAKSLTNLGNHSEYVRYWAYAMKNVWCIGDSMTQGGRTPNWTYPSILKRLINLDSIVNDGHGGWTTKQVWDNDISAKTTEFEPYDTFIVWLGTNGGLTNTLATDVDPYDSYMDYADTQTGCYCKIIEHIKAYNSNCLICLCNLFDTSGDLETSNTTIDNIAAKYDLPVINLSDQRNPRSGLHGGVDNPHYGKMGNIYIANHIVEEFAKWIDASPIRGEYYVP